MTMIISVVMVVLVHGGDVGEDDCGDNSYGSGGGDDGNDDEVLLGMILTLGTSDDDSNDGDGNDGDGDGDDDDDDGGDDDDGDDDGDDDDSDDDGHDDDGDGDGDDDSGDDDDGDDGGDGDDDDDDDGDDDSDDDGYDDDGHDDGHDGDDSDADSDDADGTPDSGTCIRPWPFYAMQLYFISYFVSLCILHIILLYSSAAICLAIELFITQDHFSMDMYCFLSLPDSSCCGPKKFSGRYRPVVSQ